MPGNEMREIGINNCYDLYKAKFGRSIKDHLEKTIEESYQEIGKKIESFVRENFQDSGCYDSNDPTATREKKILTEIIKSKNSLLNLVDSPYVHLYMKHKGNVPEFARGVTWHWLSSASEFPMPLHLKFENLKEMLISIGFHSAIYYGNDRLSAIFKEKDPSVNWPKKEDIEIYQIKHLEKKLKQFQEKLTREKELYLKLESYDKNEYNIQREANEILEKELDQKKVQLSQTEIELQLLKEKFFFHEDSFYDSYVFGDILPELKAVYTLLKEYRVYESNWGYFCHCLTLNNYSSPEPLKLKLSLRGSNFDTKDLGYVFNLLQNEFHSHSKSEYVQWLSSIVEIESSRGNQQDIEDFYRKHIRPYKKSKTGPAFYEQITEKLHFFSITLD